MRKASIQAIFAHSLEERPMEMIVRIVEYEKFCFNASILYWIQLFNRYCGTDGSGQFPTYTDRGAKLFEYFVMLRRLPETAHILCVSSLL